MSASKNWCFTLNNYNEDDINRIDALVGVNASVAYVVYGKEIGDSGTPHLQGFISFSKRLRLKQVKAIIGSNPHIEVARNVNASIKYCKKDGNWTEKGSLVGQGTRSDIEAFKTSVKSGLLDLKELRELHSEVYSKCTRFCLEYVSDHFPVIEIPVFPLRVWQTNLKNKLGLPPDRRKIIFVVDVVGNSGKSWFAHYYTSLPEQKCQVLVPGKKADMAYILKPCLSVLFLDAPRSKQGEFIQYDFLEDIKNGYVFSSKYESRVKTFAPMHVVVNMNEDPDLTKLSLDRYDILNINDPLVF